MNNGYIKLKNSDGIVHKVKFDSEEDSNYSYQVLDKLLELYVKVGFLNDVVAVLNPTTEGGRPTVHQAVNLLDKYQRREEEEMLGWDDEDDGDHNH